MEKPPEPSSPPPRGASNGSTAAAMESPDLELVHRAQRGEPEALGSLVARWNADLLRLAYRLTGDLDEAGEVRQETLVKIQDRLASFEGRSRPTSWVYRIAVNVVRDRARRRASFQRALEGAAAERVPGSADAHLPRNGREHGFPGAAQERREVSDRVAAAVAELEADEREVVVLRHYHDLPFPEIAQVVGAPVTTVKSRMTRGLERLRHRLKDLQP